MLRLLVPTTLLQFATLALGSLSIIKLYQLAVDKGLAGVVRILIVYYDDFLRYIFSGIEPLVKWLASFLGFRIELAAHWRHILVLMGLYLSRDVWLAYKREGQLSTYFHAVMGALVAVLSAMLTGAIDARPGEFVGNLAVATIPLLGLFVYAVAGRLFQLIIQTSNGMADHQPRRAAEKWAYFAYRIKRASQRTIAGFVFAGLALAIPAISELKMPGIAVFGVLMVGLGFYWLFEGLADVRDMEVKPGEAWIDAYARSACTEIGVAMLRVIALAIFILILNAGLGALPSI